MNQQTPQFSRRTALKTVAAAGIAGLSASKGRTMEADNKTAMTLAADENHWASIAKDFDVNPDIINLENGYWGIMSRPVLAKYLDYVQRVNRDSSYYARREYGKDLATVMRRVEHELGANKGEVVLTRNATEALQGLIGGYNRLQAGDAVMFADLDYYSMISAMKTLAAREQCKVVNLAIPEPTSHDGLLEFYSDALKNNPNVRLLLLTHIGHRTGLMMPVKAITAIARKMGVDVIVDAAHSFGQVDVDVDDIGADFIGFNLHKWIGAPLGVGAMYIRQNRLETIAPNLSAEEDEKDSIQGRVHTGTMNFAAVMAIPDAFDYHLKIGKQNKETRLRYLRDQWVNKVRDIKGLEILTPDDARLHAGITSFRFAGKTSVADNKAIVEQLLHTNNIFTTHRDGVAKGACVRVTPSIYNSAQDCQKLANALHRMHTTL